MSTYKIIVPKAGAADASGTEVKLYGADEVVEAKDAWQKELMDTFVGNGWAIELKTVKPEVTAVAEESEVVEVKAEKPAPKRKPRAKKAKKDE